MDPVARKALVSYENQKQRCGNPNSNRYQFYGARGIEVEYDARDFIGWWLDNIRHYTGDGKPTCGRIDHSQNYRLDNISLSSKADNTREMVNRHGGRAPRVKVVAETQDGIRLHFDSVGECARVIGINRDVLLAHLSGKIKSPIPQLTFRTL